jgi:hypothetical protein
VRLMLHDWSVAKSRRQADIVQVSERKVNHSRQKEVAVMLKLPHEVKLRPEKVYVSEEAFLEVESSLDEGSDSSDDATKEFEQSLLLRLRS